MTPLMVYLADVCTSLCAVATIVFCWCAFLAGVFCIHAGIEGLSLAEAARKTSGVFKIWAALIIVSLLVIMFVPSGKVINEMAGASAQEVPDGADR